MINYPQNPFFPEVLRKEMEYDKEHDYEKYLHIWEGEPQQLSDAMVFKGKYSVQCFETPPGTQFYYGADWGFSTDPTTLVRCFIDGRKLFIDQEAYGVGVEIDHTPDLFDTVDGSRKWKITADSARPETISYMKRQGFRMEGAKKGKDSVIEGVKFLQGYDIVCHERCKHVAYELGRYSYKTDRLTGDVIPELEDKDNHFIDALRYALEGVRRAKPFKVF
jgi:phage terminase large subunit